MELVDRESWQECTIECRLTLTCGRENLFDGAADCHVDEISPHALEVRSAHVIGSTRASVSLSTGDQRAAAWLEPQEGRPAWRIELRLASN
jgi:hypothetical protein